MPKKRLGKNQFTFDPRQNLFLEYYFDRESDTFANCTASALKAGYTASYADQITTNMPGWLTKRVQHASIVSKAETNLDNLLEAEDDKVKADMTKFALSRLDKEHYSERIENAGKGDRIEVIITDFKGKQVEQLAD